MLRRFTSSRRRYIIVDVDTQIGFFINGPDYCVNNPRKILANVRRIMAWARKRNIPIISTCGVSPNRRLENGYDYRTNGNGRKKIRYTLKKNHIAFPAEHRMDFPRDVFKRYGQIILDKRSDDPFEEPRIERILSEVQAYEFIIIGSVAEDAVKATVLGLLQRGKSVTVVKDAVGCRDTNEGRLALRKMETKGAKLIFTKKVAGKTHLKKVGVIDRDRKTKTLNRQSSSYLN